MLKRLYTMSLCFCYIVTMVFFHNLKNVVLRDMKQRTKLQLQHHESAIAEGKGRERNSFLVLHLYWWQCCWNPSVVQHWSTLFRDVTEFPSLKDFQTQWGEASGGWPDLVLRTVPFGKRAGLLDILSPNILVVLWSGTQKEGEEPALLVVKNACAPCGKGFGTSSAQCWVPVN